MRNRHAALYAARLRPGQQVLLPEAPCLHLFVARGSVELEGTGRLDEGDAVRFTATGGHRVGATGPAEILVWEMHATFEPGAVRPVDPGVIRWLTEELTWSGQEPTERMYSDYLYSAGDIPVSRQRFVQDLAYLGVPEIRNANGTCFLVRK
ncbi:hypothetical protein R6V09_17515 [Streptomyces sp. W16]|uniref:pirin family protein n=1 Tax=Streptomyces sp. W16 TaxID=3076631 RepID=UPI00295B1A43|nr:hypothetical protein [Streptomyces sp. W16]MDV9171911.1 hypothetical protein [Streptomyces sp. W16]